MLPVRAPMPQAARPAPPVSIRKGIRPEPGRKDIDAPARVQRVAGYPAQPGFVGAAKGIMPTPGVPGANSSGNARATMVQYLRSSAPRKDGDTTTKQLVQAAIGGGKPMGPAYKGYISQLVKSLIQGF